MTRFSQLGPEFDNFLFAPIGEDGNGMLLSVLSALARLDMDPWQEAAKLSGLPGAAATQRLASLIAALPNQSSAYPDPATVAARLVALLPRSANPNIPSRAPLFGAGAVTHPQAIIYVYVIFMVFALGAPNGSRRTVYRRRRSVTFMHRPRAQSPLRCDRRSLASERSFRVEATDDTIARRVPEGLLLGWAQRTHRVLRNEVQRWTSTGPSRVFEPPLY